MSPYAVPLSLLRFMFQVAAAGKVVKDENRDGQLFNNRDYFIGNNRHRLLFLDW